MAKLAWDKTGERYAEMGVDHGVVYPFNSATKEYDSAEAWNGLTAVNENPSGAEATKLWADNINYITLRSAEQYGYTIEAYTYPDAFARCDGSASPVDGVRIGQQSRRQFGFVYRTNVVNDTADEADDGYILHLIWGSTCSPSAKNHSTINESPDAEAMSWECDTIPTVVEAINPETGKPFKPFAHMEIDSRTIAAAKLTALEDILFGTANVDAYLPSPDDVITLLTASGSNSGSGSGSNSGSGSSSGSGSGSTTP